MLGLAGRPKLRYGLPYLVCKTFQLYFWEQEPSFAIFPMTGIDNMLRNIITSNNFCNDFGFYITSVCGDRETSTLLLTA